MKFYSAYNSEYYSERMTNKSKKHMMKYMKFLRKGSMKMPYVRCGEVYYVRDAMEEGINACGMVIFCSQKAKLDNFEVNS